MSVALRPMPALAAQHRVREAGDRQAEPEPAERERGERVRQFARRQEREPDQPGREQAARPMRPRAPPAAAPRGVARAAWWPGSRSPPPPPGSGVSRTRRSPAGRRGTALPTSAPDSRASATLPGTVRHSRGRQPSSRIAATCAPKVASSAAPATRGLEDEDRPPVEHLREDPAERRPDRRAEGPRERPDARPRGPSNRRAPPAPAAIRRAAARRRAPGWTWRRSGTRSSPTSAHATEAPRNTIVPAASSRFARTRCTTKTSARAQSASTRL